MNKVEVELFRHPIYAAYAADKFGEIYSLKFGKIRTLKPWQDKKGYSNFHISLERNRKTYSLHRFVYECVNNEILDENIQIDHIDRNKKNNNITNLRKVSMSTNLLNRYNNREVEKLPVDAVKVIQYNSHKFKDTYFSPTTNCIYRYSEDGYLFEIPFKKYNSTQIYSIENKRVDIYRDKLRKMLGYQ